jgi:hypothetical protein
VKNLNYFPFERNRYFYGKLLSVDDFDAEQRYMNDKRRMLNRFLHGTGVVCGLQVVEIDDVTVSLEMGLALDFSGREIVVAKPVTKKLSSIEGFSKYAGESGESRDLYLCIAYDEQPEEPVHNIARVNNEQEEEFNKYAEGYRLFVTAEEPEKEGMRLTDLYEDTKTVFQGSGIRIRQTVPKYIQSDQTAEFTVIVEKMKQTKPVSFSYQLLLSCMEHSGSNTVTVSFDENAFMPADRYVLKKRIRAKTVRNVEGYMEVVPDSFALAIGQDIRKETVYGKFRVYITDASVQQAVIRNYYSTAMEDIIRDTYEQPIYLARLSVIRAGDTYVIGKVENLPYKQYVWNNVLSAAMEAMRLERPENERIFYSPQEPGSGIPVEKASQAMQLKTGSTVIDMGIGGNPGQRFYSEEIIHGLGLGEVFISLGLSKGARETGEEIFGNPDVFGDNAYPGVELAAKADMARGSFIIGVRCLGQVEKKQLRVHWMAVRDSTLQADEKKIKHMKIVPDIANLQIRENHYFEAVIGDEVQKHVKWTVKEPEGGTIDSNGYYTAPSQSGVYEIMAESMEDQSFMAAAFVIVRDVF